MITLEVNDAHGHINFAVKRTREGKTTVIYLNSIFEFVDEVHGLCELENLPERLSAISASYAANYPDDGQAKRLKDNTRILNLISEHMEGTFHVIK